MSVSEHLAELGIDLPPVAKPLADYVPATVSGGQVRSSGQLPLVDGELTTTGKVGAGVIPDTAKASARTAALNALAAAASAAGGVDQGQGDGTQALVDGALDLGVVPHDLRE